MRILLRMAILGAGTLIIGILINQYNTRGIPWRLLLASVPISHHSNGWTFVSPDSALLLYTQKKALFIDVRDKEDFELDHIGSAVSLPFIEFYKRPSKFKDWNIDKNYILYSFGTTSRHDELAAGQLARSGFRNVFILHGGFGIWLEKNYPVERR